ncbi:MAG: UDP-glucose 4-epimerase GalE [Thermodesulfovibrionales bacterium]
MNISALVVGGAGYIGSHMVKLLAESGCEVTVFDNLSLGHRDVVLSGTFVKGDLMNKDDLKALFAHNKFDVVMHFAAFCYVGESVQDPQKYYQNNVVGTLNLLEAMRNSGHDTFLFSSSCATYGVPESAPITEDHPQRPINPYGRTKLIVEQMLADYAVAYNLKSVSLRYFNAAGCDPDGALGERHDPETHLIPLVLAEALRVRAGGISADTSLYVFGNDYDTPDGTCIRDYIHVSDLCTAHLLAAERLSDGHVAKAEAYNLGNGKGFSVGEVIDSCRRVTGVDIRYRIASRREGDPPRLVGSAEKAKSVLGWSPEVSSLDEIVATAWRWMTRNEQT